jgi:phosphatidate cytidylyltransferase
MPDKLAAPVDAPDQNRVAGAGMRNLQLRIASGLILAVGSVGLAYAGLFPFLLLVLVVGGVLSLEWSKLVRGEAGDLAAGLHLVAVAAAAILAVVGYPALALAVVAAAAVAIMPVTASHHPVLSATGVLYAGLPTVALIWLRSDVQYGFAAIVFLFLIVWSTDTMAFIAGRLIGGPKLWPAVSPNKTWAGFIGGVGSSAALCAAFAQFLPGSSALKLSVIGLFLGVVAQGGDLAESALKRRFNVKDAGQLIPGHGGFMDRLDGFVVVAVAAAVLALVWNARAPATALLLGG